MEWFKKFKYSYRAKINTLQMIKSKKKYIILFSIIILIVLSISFDSETNVNNIGVIEISGTIMDSKDIIDALDKFNNRADIKSIILRLNTPGGAVSPSQEIYEKVKNISLQKYFGFSFENPQIISSKDNFPKILFPVVLIR